MTHKNPPSIPKYYTNILFFFCFKSISKRKNPLEELRIPRVSHQTGKIPENHEESMRIIELMARIVKCV